MPKLLENVITQAHPDATTHSVALTWADGTTTKSHFGRLIGKGVFAALAAPAVFACVRIGAHGRSLVWPSGLDFCADALWLEMHPEDAATQCVPVPQHAAE